MKLKKFHGRFSFAFGKMRTPRAGKAFLNVCIGAAIKKVPVARFDLVA
jgi:hypothetical protein